MLWPCGALGEPLGPRNGDRGGIGNGAGGGSDQVGWGEGLRGEKLFCTSDCPFVSWVGPGCQIGFVVRGLYALTTRTGRKSFSGNRASRRWDLRPSGHREPEMSTMGHGSASLQGRRAGPSGWEGRSCKSRWPCEGSPRSTIVKKWAPRLTRLLWLRILTFVDSSRSESSLLLTPLAQNPYFC